MRSAPSTFDPPQMSISRLLTWAAVVMILLAAPLLINFVSRIQAESRMAAEVEQRAERLRKSEITLSQLREALEYAKSDAYTERYAREQARYAKPGEIVVVPVSMDDSASSHRAWWEDFVILDRAGAQSVNVESIDNAQTTSGSSSPDGQGQ